MTTTVHEQRAAQRQRFLRALIEQLDTEPFLPRYRLEPCGPPVIGLPARLRGYFWPDQETDYVRTQPLLEPMWLKAKSLALALQTTDGWSPQQKKDAMDLALEIFDWGRVPQDDATAEMVEAVFRSALNNQHYGDAPMNSGWTKIAAFATAHLEHSDHGFPHTIWDSRVSTSVTYRLDRILVAARIEQPEAIFPRIGAVGGRGGTRPRDLSLSWAYAYGYWSSHFAGSVLVKEVRDLLNAGGYPPMPLPDGGEGVWTIHGVGSVLFMDGY